MMLEHEVQQRWPGIMTSNLTVVQSRLIEQRETNVTALLITHE